MPLLVAVLLLAEPASERELRSAIELYRAGDFEKALSALDAVARTTTEPSVRARAHLARGQCFAALQRFDRVDAEFTKALEADPELTLDPSRVQPAIVSMLDAARARLQGELEVTGSAEVLLDGQLIGRAPLKTSAGIGRHRLELRGAGGLRDVVIRAGQVTRVEAPVVVEVPQEPQKPPEPSPAAIAVLVELRATLDPRDYFAPLRVGPVAPAPELSLGASGRHWSATAGAMLGGAFGLTVRVAGRLPELLGPLGAELAAHGVVLFDSPAAFGAAGLVGPTVALGRYLEAFLGVGGGFLGGSPAYRRDYFLITLALRARFTPG